MNVLGVSVMMPIVAGLAVLAMPDILKALARAVSVAVSALVLALAAGAFITRPPVCRWQGTPVLGVDALSAFIGLSVAAFGLLLALYSSGYAVRAVGRHSGYLLLTLGAALGVAYAEHLVVLLVAWGFLAVMLFLMTNLAGTEAASRAARKALVIVGGTDALVMLGVGLVWMETGSFAVKGAHLTLATPYTIIAYAALTMAAFAKAGAMPFHGWLPDVAESAPANVSAFLPASLDKLLGIYLLARVSLDIFVMSAPARMVLLAVGSFTIIVAVMMALVQHDMKRLLGYHAVSQVGYMVLGIGTGTVVGIAGSLFHMINNAIYKSCLFMSAGAVEQKTGTTDLDKLGGLARVMPVTFAACFIAALSISGIPPFNGFVSKWMIYQGIVEMAGRDPLWVVWLVAAMFGSALTVASFMKLLHAAFLGRGASSWKDVTEAGPAMTVPMMALAAACVVFGVFAQAIPLGACILPALAAPVLYIGVWQPVAVTALLIVGIIAGWLVYLFFRPGRYRTAETFIGGEDPDSMPRVSGVDFYTTISDLGGIRRLFAREEAGAFDIFVVGKRCTYAVVRQLQRLHNGILPSYLVWCLLGMLAMFLIVFTQR